MHTHFSSFLSFWSTFHFMNALDLYLYSQFTQQQLTFLQQPGKTCLLRQFPRVQKVVFKQRCKFPDLYDTLTITPTNHVYSTE